MNAEFDLVVLGSGFGGSLMSMIARKLGLSVLMLERGSHPRFAIGESTSPLANLILENLAHSYDLPRLLPLTKWATWQSTYPQLAVGLKRGFTYLHHEEGRPFSNRADRGDQLLVAASPRDEISDTHWYRADLDSFLVNEAVALGVEYQDRTTVDGATFDETGGFVDADSLGKRLKVRARLVIDATGPRGAISRLLELPEGRFQGYPETRMLFTHFTGVARCDVMPEFNACRGFDGERPPFNADDAALHHVFDGGWMWALRFNNGITSAGVALEGPLADQVGLAEGGDAAWHRILQRFPTIEAQFAEAKAEAPFIYSARPTYRCSAVAGARWAMLPSAAGFVDPLYSTGIPLTLLGIERLALALKEVGLGVGLESRLKHHEGRTLAELDWTASYIASNYDAFAAFPDFVSLSMFYFAAASFSEMTRRLDRPRLSPGFLGRERGSFAASMREAAVILKKARERKSGYSESTLSESGFTHKQFQTFVRSRIVEINVAGLADPVKRNWYGVDLNDVIEGAALLDFGRDELAEVLSKANWV